MKILIRLVYTLFFVAMPNLVFSQPEIEREHYSKQDGLLTNAISDILQDSRGFIWISTWEGLSRFDGFDFVNYKAGADSDIPNLHNRISRIFEDKYGNIWMLMYDEKLFRLNRRTDKFESLIGLFPNGANARIDVPLFASNGDIWVIAQNTGVLEIKTDSVSNRFTLNFHQLNDLKVNQLFEDSFSTIWAATSKGIHVLKPGKLPSKPFEENLQVTVSTQLDSCVYWGTKEGYIIKYDYANHQYTQDCIKANDAILALTPDAREPVIYVGTQHSGLLRYDVKSRTAKQIIPAPSTISSLYTDSEGLIWMFTEQPGVSMYDPQSGKHTSFRQKVSMPEEYNPVGEVIELSGVVWVRMNKGGFGFYNRATNKIDYFHNNPDVPNSMSNIVSVAEITSPHTLWIMTNHRGVDKISIINKKVERKLIEENSSIQLANEIRAFCIDRDSMLWVAAKSGTLYCLDKQMSQIHRITHDDKGNPFGRIYVIMQDRFGAFWLGTRGNGLFHMSKDEKGRLRFKRYVHDPDDPFSISANDIYSILTDSKGRMWIGTYGGGVNVIEDPQGEIRFLSAGNDLKNYPIASCHRVRAVVEDAKGQIWAGTTEGLVLMTYDEAKKDVHATVYRKEANSTTSLSSNDILCIYKDSKQGLWFGTVGGGLIKYAGMSATGKAEFTSYMIKDGLPSNEVRSITEDHDGNLWFATENNICSFNFSTGIFSKLSTLEGVDPTMFSESAATVLANGDVIFGTVNGYYLIDKQKLSDAVDEGFKLQITDFQINDEPTSPRLNPGFDNYIPESRSVTLPDRHSIFSAKFASLNYSLQHRIQYQYMLEGYDKAWRNADNERRATYAGIPAGNYTFKVKAFLPENPDNFELNSIQIQIPASFWRSKLAFAIYFFILIALGAGTRWVVYRRKSLLKEFKVLKIGPTEIAFKNDEDYKFVAGLLDWLEKNYTNPDLKIDDMVAFSGLGRTTFYNNLKTLTQMSPIEFISDFRMKKAKMYIEKSNATISEIAYQNGFNDPAYFTRLFKSKYNMTPTEYRKNASQPLFDERKSE